MVLRQQTKTLIVVSVLVTVVIVAAFINYLQTKPSGTPQPSPTPSVSTSPTPSYSPSPSATPEPSATLSASPIVVSPSPSPTVSPSSTPITLYPGEVREYQGQNLSSIADVYENAIVGTQYIDQATYNLTISGLVNNPLQLAYGEVFEGHQLYQKVVTIHCVEGWSAKILWEGVLVKDLIQNASPGATANTVIFHASDGYTTALPLEYIVNNNIIMAYKMNGNIIPPERGFPFQLVAESKYGYKWIKWITGIELSNDPNYLGYWENRGYSNDATVP
jgi:DMSO/TMAO reductase YedYZ molybdopterin-dependent catalytic subunit